MKHNHDLDGNRHDDCQACAYTELMLARSKREKDADAMAKRYADMWLRQPDEGG